MFTLLKGSKAEEPCVDIEKLRKAAEPLVRFLNENHNPHTTAIVTPIGVELVFAAASVSIEEFVKD